MSAGQSPEMSSSQSTQSGGLGLWLSATLWQIETRSPVNPALLRGRFAGLQHSDALMYIRQPDGQRQTLIVRALNR